jgi:hypothetical protein
LSVIIGSFGLIFFIGIAFFIVSQISKMNSKYAETPTFNEYKASNPKLVTGGEVTCFQCDGTQIYIRNAGAKSGKVLNYHVCRTCGTNLYRSES